MLLINFVLLLCRSSLPSLEKLKASGLELGQDGLGPWDGEVKMCLYLDVRMRRILRRELEEFTCHHFSGDDF